LKRFPVAATGAPATRADVIDAAEVVERLYELALQHPDFAAPVSSTGQE
jgi:hypothetical protein